MYIETGGGGFFRVLSKQSVCGISMVLQISLSATVLALNGDDFLKIKKIIKLKVQRSVSIV